MRKFFYTLGTIAAVVFALTSCERQEISNPDDNLVTITLKADKAGIDTKTAADEGDKVVSYLWTEEDESNMKLFIVGVENDKETLSEVESTVVNISSDNKILAITATVPANSVVRAVLSGAWTSSQKPKVNANQRPLVDNFDPNADILVSEDVVVSELNNDLLTFHRPVTVSKMTLKNMVKGEKVYEVIISSENHLTGYCNNDSMTGQEKSITLSYDDVAVEENGEFPVYFVTMPNEGHTLKVVVKTDQYNYTKTFGTLDFIIGYFAKFGVNLSECGTPVVDNDFTGDWVITGVNGDNVFAAQAYVSGANNLSALGVKLDVEKNEIVSTKVNEIKMHLEKVAEGDYAGLYTIKDASGNYLYAASSGSNYLKGTKTLGEKDYYWSVEEESDGTYSIKAIKSPNRNVMQFNSGKSLFSCYASATQEPVTLYPYSWVVEDTNVIEPSGEGTLESPYNVAAAIAYTESLGTATSPDYIYIQGTISQIDEAYGSYGNATFYISDDGQTSSPQFEAYRILYLGNVKWVSGQTNIEVGDEVILCGKVKMYNGAAEISQDGYLYSFVTGSTGGATILFGSGTGRTKINAGSVEGVDSDNNTWTITVEGTTSFTQDNSYSQVGSSGKPASSITFTTTLPETVTKVNSLSIDMGGFSGTAGNVTLKVGDEIVGTGSLDATNNVTVSSSSAAEGRVITITVTDISKGVKVYSISAEYE